jgi:hypothetical protein
VKVLAGIVMVFAAIGAWTMGRRAGREMTKATSPLRPPPPAPPAEEIEDAVEVSARPLR